VFQSHAGSIEAGASAGRIMIEALFQSHAGSIEAPFSASWASWRSSVSIPRWFD